MIVTSIGDEDKCDSTQYKQDFNVRVNNCLKTEVGLVFSLWLYSPILGLCRLHETFVSF
jgi:hypothetical protein